MNEMTHEEYVQLQRRRLVEIAQGIIDHKVDIIEGVRKIVQLGFEIDVDPDDEDIAVFVAVDSETEHLPAGAERANWSPVALKQKDAELERARRWAYQTVQKECENLLRRFGNSAPDEATDENTPLM